MDSILQSSKFQALPQPQSQVSFRVDGIEKIRWNFGTELRRPFFYPFCGPSNEPLTRMGHPGAPNHDHHQSIWFAHHKVQGIDFWSNNGTAHIRQKEWLCYRDGADEAVMAVNLDWHDGHNPQPLMTQELVAGFRMHKSGGTILELQSTFTPTSKELELEQTNFGFLAVRMAKTISAYFGNGVITDNQGRSGEPAIFDQKADWVDYSGGVLVGNGDNRREIQEGITCFNHQANPNSPPGWHVREDGWMGPSACREQSLLTSQEKPLRLRYLLFGHAGLVDISVNDELAEKFNRLSDWIVRRSSVKHTFWEVFR